MDYLRIVEIISSLIPTYIAFLAYKMNKQETERKRDKEEREENEKSVSLPPRKKRSNR